MNIEHLLKYLVLSNPIRYISKSEMEILQDRDHENYAVTLQKITRDVISDISDIIPGMDLQDIEAATTLQAAIKGVILWAADHEKEKKAIEAKAANEMAGHIIERFRPRIIADTGELYLWQGTHYAGPGLNPELRIKAQIRDYDDEISDGVINTVLNKIKEKLDLIIERAALDKDDGLSFENGYLNLETLELMPHNPDQLNTIHIPARYEPGTLPALQGDKEWTAADLDAAFEGVEYWTRLKECLPKFKDAYTFLEFLGYSLSKDLKLTRIAMHLGNGANGKSTFLEHWEAVIGPANAAHESIHELAKDKFRRANLEGKLCNVYTDVEYDEIQSGAGILKLLAEGKAVTAERKYAQPFELKSFATLMFSANSLPPVKDQSDGFFRRPIIFQWNKEIEIEDPDLKGENGRLVKDHAGNAVLFGILIQIRKRLYARGHFMQDAGPEKTRQIWNENTNHLERFINECTRPARDDEYELKDDVRERYLTYCEERRIQTWTQRTFSRHTKEYYEDDIRTIDGKSRRVWVGMQLKRMKNDKIDNTDNIDNTD